jgi:hypothetical protein
MGHRRDADRAALRLRPPRERPGPARGPRAGGGARAGGARPHAASRDAPGAVGVVAGDRGDARDGAPAGDAHRAEPLVRRGPHRDRLPEPRLGALHAPGLRPSPAPLPGRRARHRAGRGRGLAAGAVRDRRGRDRRRHRVAGARAVRPGHRARGRARAGAVARPRRAVADGSSVCIPPAVHRPVRPRPDPRPPQRAPGGVGALHGDDRPQRVHALPRSHRVAARGGRGPAVPGSPALAGVGVGRGRVRGGRRAARAVGSGAGAGGRHPHRPGRVAGPGAAQPDHDRRRPAVPRARRGDLRRAGARRVRPLGAPATALPRGHHAPVALAAGGADLGRPAHALRLRPAPDPAAAAVAAAPGAWTDGGGGRHPPADGRDAAGVAAAAARDRHRRRARAPHRLEPPRERRAAPVLRQPSRLRLADGGRAPGRRGAPRGPGGGHRRRRLPAPPLLADRRGDARAGDVPGSAWSRGHPASASGSWSTTAGTARRTSTRGSTPTRSGSRRSRPRGACPACASTGRRPRGADPANDSGRLLRAPAGTPRTCSRAASLASEGARDPARARGKARRVVRPRSARRSAPPASRRCRSGERRCGCPAAARAGASAEGAR